MKNYRLLQWASWQRLSILFVAVIAILSALLIHLRSLAPNLSPTEKITLTSSSSIQLILHNSLNAPYRLLEWLATKAPSGHLILYSRLPSVFLAVCSLILFIYILRHWYGPRSTFFGFCILLSSAWFLHISRFTGTDIEYFTAVLGLLAIQVGLDSHKDNQLMIYIWLVVNLILLFIPGMIWLFILSIFWQRNIILNRWHFLQATWQRLICLLLASIGLAALAINFIRTPHLIQQWIGLPVHFAPWLTILEQFGKSMSALVYQAPYHPELWLGRLPILDAFLSLMLAVGIAFYIQHWQSERPRMILSYFLIGCLLVAIGGSVSLSIILPLVYLVIVAGISYTHYFWLRVFPRNPIARGIGIVIVTLVIGLSCFYNLQQYFVAWPNNPETTQIYQPVSP
jgi:hypothetical protein